MRDTYRLHRNTSGQLIYETIDETGETVSHEVTIREAFPWTHPQAFLSLRTSKGKELAFVPDLSARSQDEQLLIRQALDESRFVPRILKVTRIVPRERLWDVLTDRGQTEIKMQDRQDVNPLADGRYLITDVFGNMYLLPALDELDSKSRRFALEMI